jgi:hypothetical protein
MWELLVLLLVVFGVHWWEYRSSIQEYTFAQPSTLDRHDELSTVLQEKTPIAVEIGSLPWRPQVAEKAAWTVTVESNGSEMDMPVSQWLKNRSEIGNKETLAEEMELANGLADIDAGRPWWWLPEMRDCNVSIFNKDEGRGLKWISAERHWIGCSHGTPLTLWLVHSRYRRYLPNSAVNPWTLTVVEAPWIGRVQYIEVTIKPGWCIGLPAHWGFAVKADDESWMWSANQHSLVSFGLAKLTG